MTDTRQEPIQELETEIKQSWQENPQPDISGQDYHQQPVSWNVEGLQEFSRSIMSTWIRHSWRLQVLLKCVIENVMVAIESDESYKKLYQKAKL